MHENHFTYQVSPVIVLSVSGDYGCW